MLGWLAHGVSSGGPKITASANASASNTIMLRGSKSKIRRLFVGKNPIKSGCRDTKSLASSYFDGNSRGRDTETSNT
jgi:hypothetical protein